MGSSRYQWNMALQSGTGRATFFRSGSVKLGRRLPTGPWGQGDRRPDWQQANPRSIERSLHRALRRTGGGWCVVDASSRVGSQPRQVDIGGRAYVIFRGESGQVVMGPNRCPHMGAKLHEGKRDGDTVVCPWHGMPLSSSAPASWRCTPTFDDGVLVWARALDGEDEPATAAPISSPRPRVFVSGVVRVEARCEPADILANRLDPWHGAHFHPHSFAHLRVLSVDEDRLRVRVGYRALGPLVVDVDCTFHAPTRRSIVMTIVDGEGTGSVVETHATPLSAGRTAIVEATLATSNRRGFGMANRLSPLVRPLIERRAARLWEDDVAYAERRYDLRQIDAAG